MPNVRSVRSKQNSVLRYVVSTSPTKAAGDLNVSPNTIERFVNAKPTTIKKNPERYRKLLDSSPTSTAKQKDVKLVQKLSGKRLRKAYQRAEPTSRQTAAIRYAKATRQYQYQIKEGKVVQKPIAQSKVRIERKQILAGLGGTRSASIMEQYRKGDLKESEARAMIRKLWTNSDMSIAQADDYFNDNA